MPDAFGERIPLKKPYAASHFYRAVTCPAMSRRLMENVPVMATSRAGRENCGGMVDGSPKTRRGEIRLRCDILKERARSSAG